MRSHAVFVKDVNTTNCARLLGQAQDVDVCGNVEVRERQVGGAF